MAPDRRRYFGPPALGHTGATDGLARPLVRWCRILLYPCGVDEGLRIVGPPLPQDRPTTEWVQVHHLRVGNWINAKRMADIWQAPSRDVAKIISGATAGSVYETYAFYVWPFQAVPGVYGQNDLGFSHANMAGARGPHL